METTPLLYGCNFLDKISHDSDYVQCPDLYSTYELHDFTNKYCNITEMQLLDLESKHVALADSKRKTELIKLGEQVGYNYVLWGTHRGKWINDDTRLRYELDRVESMVNYPSIRPIRIVICSNGKVFADNSHWALASAKKFGCDVKLKQIPFYIVDFTNPIPNIINNNGSVIQNEIDIMRTINAAGKIEQRVLNGWRINDTYSMRDLHNELQEWQIIKNFVPTNRYRHD